MHIKILSSKVVPEYLSSKEDIGLQTVECTLEDYANDGVQTTIQPLIRQVLFYHLNLHLSILHETYFFNA